MQLRPQQRAAPMTHRPDSDSDGPSVASFQERPLILLLDDDIGRVEFMEYRLVHERYQADVTPVKELEAYLRRKQPKVIVSFLPLEAGVLASHGIPLIMMVGDEVAEQQRVDGPDPPGVVRLSRSGDLDDLFEKIAEFVGRDDSRG